MADLSEFDIALIEPHLSQLASYTFLGVIQRLMHDSVWLPGSSPSRKDLAIGDIRSLNLSNSRNRFIPSYKCRCLLKPKLELQFHETLFIR